MASNATAVATRPTSEIGLFQVELEKRARNIQMALPAHISPDKFQRTVITAVAQNPDLLKADRNSLILACYKAAHSGLLPDGRESALVVFRNRKKVNGQWMTIEEVAFIEMVYGVRKKILQARDADGKPVVSALYTGVVYKREVDERHFYYDLGAEPPLGHRPMLELTIDDAADANIVGAYSIATMADGTRSYKFLRRFEIDKIRETSKTGATKNRDGTARDAKGPWVEWYPQMCEKTALKQHAKSLPQSGDLIIEADDDDSTSSMSAAALLSVPGGEPTVITDESGNVIDAATGEVLEDAPDNQNAADDTSETNAPPAEEEPKPARGRGKAKPEPTTAEEANPPAPPVDEPIAVDEPPQDEQTGVTKDPFEAAADNYLDRFAKATTIIDLNTAHTEFEKESEGWPYEIVQAIQAGHKRHQRRLAPAAAQPEVEPAK